VADKGPRLTLGWHLSGRAAQLFDTLYSFVSVQKRLPGGKVRRGPAVPGQNADSSVTWTEWVVNKET